MPEVIETMLWGGLIGGIVGGIVGGLRSYREKKSKTDSNETEN